MLCGGTQGAAAQFIVMPRERGGLEAFWIYSQYIAEIIAIHGGMAYSYVMTKETKDQRFVRVAERRVQNILKAMRSLSQCANPKIYAWDDGQLRKIWKAIDTELERCKQSFSDPEGHTFRL